MSILRLYGHFAAPYGTCWLAWSSPAFFGNAFHINRFEFYGLIAVSLGYAEIRMLMDKINRHHQSQDAEADQFSD